MRPARASQAAASFAAIALQAAVTSRAVCVSSTSSGKSIAAAMAASRDVISSRAVRTNAETPPSICRTALRMARSLPARIIRITPSACARSMRPFRNARYVNSPGSAIRAPAAISSLRILPTSACEPWQ